MRRLPVVVLLLALGASTPGAAEPAAGPLPPVDPSAAPAASALPEVAPRAEAGGAEGVRLLEAVDAGGLQVDAGLVPDALLDALPPLDLPLALPDLLGRAARRGVEASAQGAPADDAWLPGWSPVEAGLAAVEEASEGDAPAPPGEAPLRPLPEEAPLDDAGVVPTLALGATALWGLLAKLYARLQRRALLRSPARARIHALVLARPGATLADLGDATGLGRGALVHHCQMLERHGLVASRHDGLRRRFYPPGERPLGEPRPPTPKEARVILLVRERGPLTQAEIAALLGVTRQAVHEQVRRLERDRRLVPRDADGERRWLAAEPEGAPAEAPRPLA